MNGYLRTVYLQSLITESLNIESIEYSYILPILIQEAEYWGDIKLISISNIMMQQIKQYFNYAAYVHMYISKKHKNLFELGSYKDINIVYEQKMKFDIENESIENFYSSEISNKKIRNGIINENQKEKMSYLLSNRYDMNAQSLLKYLHDIDEQILGILANIEPNFHRTCLLNSISASFLSTKMLRKKESLELLKSLYHRKLWKATQWYPLIANIAHNNRMLYLSSGFRQMSRSEQKMSYLIMELMQEKCQ